ncbi:hypothetical protein QBC45DRAFT_392207 [Copromyces sp. CBS 386.78]|nr:hypothetical protein QBC45DRAFT_392207 [Copromyces sp. CBS 386.78]
MVVAFAAAARAFLRRLAAQLWGFIVQRALPLTTTTTDAAATNLAAAAVALAAPAPAPPPSPALSPPASPGLFARRRRAFASPAPSPPRPGTRAPPTSPVLDSLGRDDPRRATIPPVEEYFRQLPQGGR